MEVKALSVNEVFIKNRALKVPYFQRPYVWKEENWEKFFNDIADVADTIEDEDAEGYFMGSIILRKGKNHGSIEQYDVIDGQQRLTTIVLFMKALYLRMGDNATFMSDFCQSSRNGVLCSILVPNRNDQIVFNAIFEKEIASTTGIDMSTQMGKAFEYFLKRLIEAETNPEDPYYRLTAEKMLDSIIANVRLVRIELAKYENAQKIFETINNTGIRLTTGELLKNYLFNESSVDLYERTWMQVFEKSNFDYWNGDLVNGRMKDSNIENFFYRYMLIKMHDDQVKPNLTPKDKKEYRKMDALFPKFKRLIETSKLDKERVVEEIISYASKYHKAFDETESLANPAPAYQGIERLALFMFATNNWTMTPYVLYILNNVQSVGEQNRIFAYVENYLVRRLICKSSNNNYSDMFSENLIGQGVVTYDAFKDYVNDTANRGALLMPTDQEVIDAIASNDLHLSATAILYLLESRINDNVVSMNGFQDFTYDYVRGIKENASWAVSGNYKQEESEAIFKTLGNLVLLTTKLTTKQKKGSVSAKFAAIADATKDLIFGPTLTTLTKWDENDVNARNEWLASKAIEAWPI